MKKQNIRFRKTIQLLLLTVTVCCYEAQLIRAQEAVYSESTLLEDDGARHTVSAAGLGYYDFFIPENTAYRYLYLRAEGADGGKKEVKEAWGTTRFVVEAGQGATIIAVFEIGNGEQMIPPASLVRFIPGYKAPTRTGQTSSGGGGGGGTAVFFKKPADPAWQMLVVAGGGGGAYSNCCGNKHPGKPAETGSNGSKGEGDTGGNGGKNGSIGQNASVVDIVADGGGGGGGSFDELMAGGDTGGSSGWPSGDKDPTMPPFGSAGGANLSENGQGGTGFGGGGVGGQGGGGGGGYSGGGGGGVYRAGGGGGSYIKEMAKAAFRKANGTTSDTRDGFVEYQFRNILFQTVRLEKYTNKCLDDDGAQTANGTNIQLHPCNGNQSQNWFLDGLMIKYAAELGKCLDLTSSDTNTGTNIQLYDCNGTGAQNWIFDGLTRNIRSGLDLDKCLHAGDGAGTGASNITLWECKAVDNMRWTVEGATMPAIASAPNRIRAVKDSGKCIDLQQSNTANGSNIQLYQCNSSEAQNWYFDGNSIRLNKDHAKCLDLNQSKTNNGNNIQLWDCNGTNAQKWTYNAMTRSFHSWVEPGKCIDVTSSNFTNGTNIQLWDCNGTDAQQFEIY